jgi:hypothetical protein
VARPVLLVRRVPDGRAGIHRKHWVVGMTDRPRERGGHRWVWLILGSILLGLMMALWSEFDSIRARSAVAGGAGLVLGIALRGVMLSRGAGFVSAEQRSCSPHEAGDRADPRGPARCSGSWALRNSPLRTVSAQFLLDLQLLISLDRKRSPVRLDVPGLPSERGIFTPSCRATRGADPHPVATESAVRLLSAGVPRSCSSASILSRDARDESRGISASTTRRSPH